jgi:hypothetical protein
MDEATDPFWPIRGASAFENNCATDLGVIAATLSQ